MAADATEVRGKHVTLIGSTVYWLAISQPWDQIEIENRDAIGGDVCYAVVGDGNTTAPTVAGDDEIVIMPQSSKLVRCPVPGESQVIAVKMISSGTPDMSVTGHPA